MTQVPMVWHAAHFDMWYWVRSNDRRDAFVHVIDRMDWQLGSSNELIVL